MVLDLTTLLVVSAAVVVLISALFISEAWVRRGSPVDRLWSLAFIAVIATALATLVSWLSPQIWWSSALANGSTVLAVWTMWSGVRAYDGRRALLEVSASVATLVALAAFLHGPDAGTWAGGGAMLTAVALGGALIAVAVLRGPMREYRSAITLVTMAVLLSAYYLCRLVGYLVLGPGSPGFRLYFGTELSTLVLSLLVTGTAFAMVALRSAQAADRRLAEQAFDPVTGARMPASFQHRAGELLAEAETRNHGMCLVVLVPEGLEAIEVAFGRRTAERALAACGETAGLLTGSRSVLGSQNRLGPGFEVLVPEGPDVATRCAERLAEELVDAPIEVPGSRLRLTLSSGVACVQQHGYDLRALRAAADQAVRAALAEGGDRVVQAQPAGARR